MAIITLTTDYGNKDYSVSSLKAKLISNIDNIRIVDISHDISPFNLSEAGYVLEGAFRDFPKGTIHILSVDSELTPENRHIAITYEGSFFIGADNGVFSLIFRDKKPDQIVEINIHNNYNNNISADELFVKVASHIKRSGPLNVVGTEIENIKEITNLRPVINKEINQKALGFNDKILYLTDENSLLFQVFISLICLNIIFNSFFISLLRINK